MKNKKSKEELFRQLPSVDQVMDHIRIPDYKVPYKMIRKSVRNSLNAVRKEIRESKISQNIVSYAMESVKTGLLKACDTKIKPVINGTGIILHTGLGRAPMSKELVDNVKKKLTGYSSVEFNTETGRRGERSEIVKGLITALTNSESSLVVNNNAAAVLLMLNSLAEGKEVIISRGQQVEIGGSFRIPDIIQKSGCTMVEIGTTNKTHLIDYRNAINENTGAVLVAHTSNYRVLGFTSETNLAELSNLCKRKRIPLIMDLGSGAVADMAGMGLPAEPLVSKFIKNGVSVLSFSGDKLLGGPQAGIICGKDNLIKKIHRNPMYRTMRCDKIIYIFMEAILKTYFKPDRISPENLVWFLFQRPRDELTKISHTILSGIHNTAAETVQITSVNSITEAGSGSLPLEQFPSVALEFKSRLKPAEIAAGFRTSDPPVIGYIQNNKFRLDLKAVLPGQEYEIIKTINTLFP